MRPRDDRTLRGVLREQARRHVPDRDAMLAMIERRRAVRRPATAFLRPVAAALAVALVLVAGITGIHLAGRSRSGGPAAGTPGP